MAKSMWKVPALFALGLWALSGGPLAAADAQADSKFFKEAASGGMLEIKLGELAEQNADSNAVKQFGERMVRDHTMAANELKKIAAARGWTVPTEMSEKDQAHYQHLKGLKGAEFDKAYIKHMVKDHNNDIEEFNNEATNGGDPQLKAFATQTLPILKEHLKLAKETASKVGVSTSNQDK